MLELSLGEIPFYFNMQPVAENPNGIPDSLPFSLYKNDEDGVVSQKYSHDTEAALVAAYRRGSNISGLMDNFGIGRRYAEDFLKFIEEEVYDFNGKKVLEIGCGTGYLLSLIRDKGGLVSGIEPGEYGKIGREKWGLNIRQSFFDVNDISEKYDIIVFYCVLEHIKNYREFFRDVKSILNTDGRIFCSVPDCQPYFKHGDISVFMHEHYNYFTRHSMKTFLDSMGVQSIIRIAGFGGVIYSSCGMEKDNIANQSSSDEYLIDLTYLEKKIRSTREKISEFMEKNSNKSIGIYCPIRLINYFAQFPSEVKTKIRFFDDDENFHNLFFPGINVPIENYNQLKCSKVDVMLVASWTFSDSIKNKCESIGIKQCVSIKDLMDEDRDTV